MESSEDIHRKVREVMNRHWDDWDCATELTKMIEAWQGEAYDEGAADCRAEDRQR